MKHLSSILLIFCAAFVVTDIHVLKYLQLMQTNLHYQYPKSKIVSSSLKNLVRDSLYSFTGFVYIHIYADLGLIRLQKGLIYRKTGISVKMTTCRWLACDSFGVLSEFHGLTIYFSYWKTICNYSQIFVKLIVVQDSGSISKIFPSFLMISLFEWQGRR